MKIESIHLTSIGLQSPDYEIIEKYLSNVKSAFFVKKNRVKAKVRLELQCCCVADI